LPACRGNGGFRTSAARLSPFDLVFGEIAPARFPAITGALQRADASATDRDRFVLLDPVGRLLREIVPEDAGPDALEAHVLLLHHAYLFWAAGERIYPIGEHTLRRAVAETRITTAVPYAAQYLQLPELRVWGSPSSAGPPSPPAEPLDGMFVSRADERGAIAVLAIFGLRPDRPGFNAVGLDGRADPNDPSANEIDVAMTRDDGSPAFTPKLAGGTAAGLYSVATAGELLLLTSRLLTLLDSG
jgi:hypothetical protein